MVMVAVAVVVVEEETGAWNGLRQAVLEDQSWAAAEEGDGEGGKRDQAR